LPLSLAVALGAARRYASRVVTASRYVITVFGLWFSVSSDRRKRSARTSSVGPDGASGVWDHFEPSENLPS